ncbi:MAG: ATP-binding cassette domain-containing protein, partial [Firmicutes bacterium]|nr:ATP-binding cassette domain-containing protein [Bacillota bacterium]
HQLSGGQKQRIAIAGILAMEPDCIILDEPTAMLDPRGRADLMKTIEQLHQQGKTIVLITHFMEEAARADRIIVMSRGRIALDGTPQQVFSHAKQLEELKLALPFAVELAEKLRAAGLAIPEGTVSEKELAEAICNLK